MPRCHDVFCGSFLSRSVQTHNSHVKKNINVHWQHRPTLPLAWYDFYDVERKKKAKCRPCVPQTWVQPWLNYSSPAGNWKWLTSGKARQGKRIRAESENEGEKNATGKRRSSSKPDGFKQRHQAKLYAQFFFHFSIFV